MAWVVDTGLVIYVLVHDPAFGAMTAAHLDAYAAGGFVLCPVSHVDLAPALLGDDQRQLVIKPPLHA